MRKPLFALSLILLWACKEKGNVSIEGKIDHAEGQMLYLDHLKLGGTTSEDSVKLNKEGAFQFSIKLQWPEFYSLRLSNGKSITLLAEENDNMLIYSKAENMSKKYIVEGSHASKLVKQLHDTLLANKKKLAQISKQIKTTQNDAKANSPNQQALTREYMQVLQNQRDFSADFIMKNPTSLASYMALYQQIAPNVFTLNENEDIQYVKTLASSMKALYPEHEYTKAILANLETLNERLAKLKFSQLVKEQGINFPEIKLPDANGKELALSSLNGKFIVLCFWASQDENSRKENRNLRKIYRKYKNKGLEIYQISVDKDEKQWKKALKDDQMTWINVCNPKTGSAYEARLLNIQQLPANYLMDKNGEIVGKNLFGNSLEEKIDEYL